VFSGSASIQRFEENQAQLISELIEAVESPKY